MDDEKVLRQSATVSILFGMRGVWGCVYVTCIGAGSRG